jgi:hypothetical protein
VQDSVMSCIFSSDVLDRPEDLCSATILISYHLVPFLLNVNFANYVARLQPISFLHTIKQIQPSVTRSTSSLTLTGTGR